MPSEDETSVDWKGIPPPIIVVAEEVGEENDIALCIKVEPVDRLKSFPDLYIPPSKSKHSIRLHT